MNNIIKIIVIFIFIANCSLNKNSKFWTNEKVVEEKQQNIEEIFKKEEALKLEFNSNLKISLYSKPIDKSFINNFDNNNGRINYRGDLKKYQSLNFLKLKIFINITLNYYLIIII